MTARIAIPAPAALLGGAGLIPFAAAALALPLLHGAAHDFALRALLGYGAVILSFLGGVRWGLAMAAPSLAALGFAVLPSLLGWAALLLPGGVGLALLAAGFVLMLLADTLGAPGPAWYPRLRVPLSLGAVASLLLGVFTA